MERKVTKNETTAAVLHALIIKFNGDVKSALNSLGGEDFYEKFAGEVYEAIRSK